MFFAATGIIHAILNVLTERVTQLVLIESFLRLIPKRLYMEDLTSLAISMQESICRYPCPVSAIYAAQGFDTRLVEHKAVQAVITSKQWSIGHPEYP